MNRARDRAGARRRRGGALAGIVAVVLGVLAGIGPLAPTAAQAADPDEASIVVSSLTPLIPTAGSTLRVTGEVRNAAGAPMTDVQVRLRLSSTPLGSRTELAAVAAGQTTSRDGRVVARQSVVDLGPGDRTGFDLSLPLNEVLGNADFGVFVLSVEVRASLAGDGFGRVGIVRTFLPWVPAHRDFAPTQLAWLWPLQDRPRRTGDGTVYTDDGLAGELSGDGRLARLVTAGQRLAAKVPVAWVVDPDLLDTASDMRASYRVLGPDGRLVPGTGSAQATSWLQAVRTATTRGDVVALPYADPDLVAVRRAGLGADLRQAQQIGAEVAGRLLDRAVSNTVAWPADGLSDQATLDTLAAGGTTAVVLSSDALAPSLNLPYTPTGRAEVPTRTGDLQALLADSGLTGILADTHDPAGPVLQVQRFLAETAMITDEQPSRSRILLVAPPRNWDPSDLTLDRLVNAVTSAPWLRGVSLSALERTPAPEIDRSPLTYPKSAARAELPRGYLLAVSRLRSQLMAFAGALTDRTAIVPDYEKSLLRLESVGWRGNSARTAAADQTARALAAEQGKVRVLGGTYTFGSKSGAIPLTIDNELSQAVTVQIALRVDNPRLRVRSVGPIQVQPNRKTQIVLPATGRANGRVVVTAQLLNPAGQPIGTPARLDVHITRYGTLALLFTGGVAALLFAVAGYRAVRRIRAGGAPPAPQPGGQREEQAVG